MDAGLKFAAAHCTKPGTDYHKEALMPEFNGFSKELMVPLHNWLKAVMN